MTIGLFEHESHRGRPRSPSSVAPDGSRSDRAGRAWRRVVRVPGRTGTADASRPATWVASGSRRLPAVRTRSTNPRTARGGRSRCRRSRSRTTRRTRRSASKITRRKPECRRPSLRAPEHGGETRRAAAHVHRRRQVRSTASCRAQRRRCRTVRARRSWPRATRARPRRRHRSTDCAGDSRASTPRLRRAIQARDRLLDDAELGKSFRPASCDGNRRVGRSVVDEHELPRFAVALPRPSAAKLALEVVAPLRTQSNTVADGSGTSTS